MPNQDTTTPDTQARARLREAAEQLRYDAARIRVLTDKGWDWAHIARCEEAADAIDALLDRLDSLERELADTQKMALGEAQGSEWLQERCLRAEDALRHIARFPKGWQGQGSISDFIASVLPKDSESNALATLDTHEEGDEG